MKQKNKLANLFIIFSFITVALLPVSALAQAINGSFCQNPGDCASGYCDTTNEVCALNPNTSSSGSPSAGTGNNTASTKIPNSEPCQGDYTLCQSNYCNEQGYCAVNPASNVSSPGSGSSPASTGNGSTGSAGTQSPGNITTQTPGAVTGLPAATVPAAATTQQSTPIYSGGQAGVTQYLCTPESTGGLFACINQIYKFAIVVAAVVGVFFIVVAGYIYMSADGAQESVDKAKDILVSTLTALVILFVGYVLLAAINPDLVKFNPIQPPNVTLQTPVTTSATPSGTTPTTGQGQGTVSSTVSAAAQSVLSLNGSGLTISSSSSQCPGNSPLSQIQTLVNGMQVPFDSPSGCSAGYTGVSSQMLTAFAGAANAGNNFTISAMTNGHHSAINDPHYQGLAADLVPNPQNVSAQQSLINYLQSSGSASIVAIECQLPGSTNEVYWPVPAQAQANDSRCVGQSNYHIHAQWSN